MKLDIAKLKQIFVESSQCNWYADIDTIRGPWNRWFAILHNSEANKHMAPYQNDIRYAATAMTYFPELIRRVEMLEKMVKEYQNETN